MKERLKRIAQIAAVSCAALAVHGYHLGTDDGAIYVPAIKQIADPSLFPANAQFFSHHAKFSVFPQLIGWTGRALGSTDAAIFAWYLFGLVLLFAAARKLLCLCFETERARWGGVLLLAAALVVPVAGTALILVDPYLTARSLSTPATLMVIACLIGRQRVWASLWFLFLLSIHPQMSVYVAAFAACIVIAQSIHSRALAVALVLPLSFSFEAAHGAYREVLLSRPYFSVWQWEWYEWVGVLAPLLILWWMSRTPLRGTLPPLRVLSRIAVPFGLSFSLGAVVIASFSRFAYFLRLQPMRCFHVIYLLLFLFLGGLLGEYVLAGRPWRWAAFFFPLFAAMWLLQISSYVYSEHIEWPGATYASDWLRAFQWVRGNTPKDAFFAIDPRYMDKQGVDLHGFRAIAERSALADEVKDSGAASVFPELAEEWKAQVAAQEPWKSLGRTRLKLLRKSYGVNWIVLEESLATRELVCPYRNPAVAICRI